MRKTACKQWVIHWLALCFRLNKRFRICRWYGSTKILVNFPFLNAAFHAKQWYMLAKYLFISLLPLYLFSLYLSQPMLQFKVPFLFFFLVDFSFVFFYLFHFFVVVVVKIKFFSLCLNRKKYFMCLVGHYFLYLLLFQLISRDRDQISLNDLWRSSGGHEMKDLSWLRQEQWPLKTERCIAMAGRWAQMNRACFSIFIS